MVGLVAQHLAGYEIDSLSAIEIIERGRVHTRPVGGGFFPDLPDDVGAGGVVVGGEDDGGVDHVVGDLVLVDEGEVGDVESDVVGEEELAAALGGIGDVELVASQAGFVFDTYQGSGAGHVGAVGVETPCQPPRGGFKPAAERHVELAGVVIKFPGEFGA